MKKRLLAFALTLAMALSLTVPAMAYNTKDFVDVPADNWAYDSVMRMADRGIVKGTGNKMFSPNGIATAEQFITLVGRIVFPDVKTTGSDWSGPYIAAAKEKGMLAGTGVTNQSLKSAISRYDMAMILRAAARILGAKETLAEPSAIGDFDDITNRYSDAVRAVYGMGLITGDENHNFNGQKSMRRNELAMVMDRLLKLNGENAQDGTGTGPEKPDGAEPPADTEPAKMATYTVWVTLCKTDHAIGRPVDDKLTWLSDVSLKVYYTKDGGTTSELVYEGVTGNKKWDSSLPHGEGKGECAFTLELPEDAFSSEEKGIYVSAETELDGQRLVTSDLRTDGRAHKDIYQLELSSDDHAENNYRRIELTPPDGEKLRFTFQGHVCQHFSGSGEKWGDPVPGFTVQLYLADGRLLGEAVSQEDGSFSMECVVDALDGAFGSPENSMYYCTTSGYYGGVRHEFDGKDLNGKLVLMSLWQMGIYDYQRGIVDSDFEVSISEFTEIKE